MDNKKVFLKCYKANGGRNDFLLYTHGYREHGFADKVIINHNLERGQNVIVWNQPGHGKNPIGDLGVIEDYRVNTNAMLQVLAQVLRKDHHASIRLLSHSFGCSITVLALAHLYERGLTRILSKIQCVVLVTPAFHVDHNVGLALRATMPIASALLYSKRVRDHIQIPWGGTQDLTKDGQVAEIIKNDPYVYRGKLSGWTANQIRLAGEKALKQIAKIHDTRMYIIYAGDDPVVRGLTSRERKRSKLADDAEITVPNLLHYPFNGKGSEALWECVDHCFES